MSMIQNVPALSILLPMFAAIITSVLKGKKARYFTYFLVAIEVILSVSLLVYLVGNGDPYVYVMGQFPAPWGNELRAGRLEAGVATLFAVITMLSIIGGTEELRKELRPGRENLYYIMIDLTLTANIALVYTNDLFTGYVFIEINTIAACGLIMCRNNDNNIICAIRYMVMSLVGSGMILLGISFTYDITGHLLMQPLQQAVGEIMVGKGYITPMVVALALMAIGLSIKCALWPFHTWLPTTYAYGTPASSAILSSVVSKGYIILLIKIILRIFGLETFVQTNIHYILFALGIIGMVWGSVMAIRMKSLRRMIAFSSVAQIGYIFMGIGMGTMAGMRASVYHIFAHSAAKSLAFIAAAGLIRASGNQADIVYLKGAGYRNKIAGIGYAASALSMVGIPGFAGFISKVMFAKASLDNEFLAVTVLSALAISTLLNAIYFMRVAIVIYTPLTKEERAMGKRNVPVANHRFYALAIIGFIVFNIAIGVAESFVGDMIASGLATFG